MKLERVRSKAAPRPLYYTGHADHQNEAGRDYHEILDDSGFEVVNQNGLVGNKYDAALIAHWSKHGSKLLEIAKTMLLEFDKLALDGNLSAALDLGLNAVEMMKFRKDIEAAEKVEGV